MCLSKKQFPPNGKRCGAAGAKQSGSAFSAQEISTVAPSVSDVDIDRVDAFVASQDGMDDFTETDEDAAFNKKHPVKQSHVPSFIATLISKLQALVAKHIDLSDDDFARYAQHTDSSVRTAAAFNQYLPQAFAEELATDGEPEVREALALNDTTPPHILAALAEDKDIRVRRAVASNEMTPSESLTALSREDDVRLRESLATNTHSPQEVLVGISKIKPVPQQVLEALSSNPFTPPEILGRYYSNQNTLQSQANDSRQVLRCLATNPSTPVKALRKLARSLDGETRLSARRSLRTVKYHETSAI